MPEGFLLDPDVAYFNHGGYGACPVSVFEEYQRLQLELEREPTELLGRRFSGLLHDARAALASFVGAHTDVEPEELIANIGIRTRAVVVSQVTSPTALVLPVEDVCEAARKAGVLSIVDGAHVPGHLPLDLEALGADVYAGNCHKWLCAPKGAGFLWAREEHQDWIEPLVISWGYHEDADFGERHGWQGTRDPAAYLAVPKAIEAHAAFDAERRRALADDAEQRLAPYGLRPLRGTRAPFMRALTVRASDPDALWRRLYDDHRVEVPVYEWEGISLLRVSIGPYNDEADLERLADAVKHALRA
jgi:isopenicillin-N epimerase